MSISVFSTDVPAPPAPISEKEYHTHDDVIKWSHFPRYWPFVWGIRRWPMNSPHKEQWCGALLFLLICALNKRLRKQSWRWWFETPLRSLWGHFNESKAESAWGCQVLSIWDDQRLMLVCCKSYCHVSPFSGHVRRLAIRPREVWKPRDWSWNDLNFDRGSTAAEALVKLRGDHITLYPHIAPSKLHGTGCKTSCK